MKLPQLARAGLLALLCLAACGRSTPINLSTPTEALLTQQTAMRRRDVVAYKRILSRRALQWLEGEAARRQKSGDEALRDYLEHGGTPGEAAQPSDVREEKLGEGVVRVSFKSNGERAAVTFTKEGDEWKVDSF